MLWIPGLSLVVFFLFIVPFMFYGYKKGWVYALSFSVVLWLLTLIFISINYLLYEDYLWDFFYEIFLKKNLSVDIDFKNLSKFYKTQAILFVTGIEFILIYPMTFLIMFFINNFIKKYFGHKYAAISKSQKEIVHRRNISSSKLTGAAILTVSTLFSASLFTSFTNVMLIPQQKRNFASNINDTMGRIYSLGLTNNPESAQIISEFISDKLDNKLSTSMQELMNFKSDETTTSNTFPNMEKINYFESKQKDFNNLYKNEEATRGVFSSVIRNQKQLNPLAFDNNTSVLTNDVFISILS